MVSKLLPKTENDNLDCSSDSNFQTFKWANPVQELVCDWGFAEQSPFITAAAVLVVAVVRLFVEEEIKRCRQARGK